MLKNLANLTVMISTIAAVGTISYLAIAGKSIPDALERLGSNFGSGVLGMASGAAVGVAAGKAMADRENKSNEEGGDRDA